MVYNKDNPLFLAPSVTCSCNVPALPRQFPPTTRSFTKPGIRLVTHSHHQVYSFAHAHLPWAPVPPTDAILILPKLAEIPRRTEIWWPFIFLFSTYQFNFCGGVCVRRIGLPLIKSCASSFIVNHQGLWCPFAPFISVLGSSACS